MAALAAGLALAACQSNRGGVLSDADVALALKTLAAAPEQGFAPGAFGEQRIARLLHSTNGDERVEGQRALTEALIAYARAEHGLRIPRSAMPKDWGLRAEPYDATVSLQQAIAGGQFKAWLASQPSPLPAYQALQHAYVAYLKIYAAGGWPAVPAGPTLKPGASGDRVTALRNRLAVEDPAVAAAPREAPFDAGLAAAVSSFQASHGLNQTGVVDAATLQELNVPAEARAAQIRANLERLRWLPRQDPATRIDVNTAAATMDYVVDGKPATHMLAAAGKPGDETPMLASAIKTIVLNPAWHVPDSIADKELLPKEAENPGYLASKDFVQKDGRLVQQPGPDSALGVVKFNFDNPYAVYLHDTPAKAAFARSQRAVSHGCVRLAQAVDLAKQVLAADADGWPPSRVDQVLADQQTTTVTLKKPIPVRLVYLTAFVEGDHVAFRPDLYGWDAALVQLIDHPPPGRKPGQRA